MIRASFLSASIESTWKSGAVSAITRGCRACASVSSSCWMETSRGGGGSLSPIGSFVCLNPGIVAAAGIRESQTRGQYISRERDLPRWIEIRGINGSARLSWIVVCLGSAFHPCSLGSTFRVYSLRRIQLVLLSLSIFSLFSLIIFSSCNGTGKTPLESCRVSVPSWKQFQTTSDT